MIRFVNFDDESYFRFEGHDAGRKSRIISWFKKLFNAIGEQSVLDNSVIVNNGTLDHLANLGSEIGASVHDFVSFFLWNR